MKKIKVNTSILQEFKEFISRGNVIDMAVGVIMGTAFKEIITSIVDNILMPLIGLLMGGKKFEALSIVYKDATIQYGMFIQNVVDFLIIAACLFFMIKMINFLTHLRKKKEEEEKQEEAKDPEPTEEAKLLMEIRDLLKKEN